MGEGEMGIDKDDVFEIMYFFQDPEFGTLESDYLGVMFGEEILRRFPEVSESKLEEIKRVGSGTVILSVISGDYISINYVGKVLLPEGAEEITPVERPAVNYKEGAGCGCLIILLVSGVLLGCFLFLLSNSVLLN